MRSWDVWTRLVVVIILQYVHILKGINSVNLANVLRTKQSSGFQLVIWVPTIRLCLSCQLSSAMMMLCGNHSTSWYTKVNICCLCICHHRPGSSWWWGLLAVQGPAGSQQKTAAGITGVIWCCFSWFPFLPWD